MNQREKMVINEWINCMFCNKKVHLSKKKHVKICKELTVHTCPECFKNPDNSKLMKYREQYDHSGKI